MITIFSNKYNKLYVNNTSLFLDMLAWYVVVKFIGVHTCVIYT